MSELKLETWFYLRLQEEALSYNVCPKVKRNGGRVLEDSGYVVIYVKKVAKVSDRAVRLIIEAENSSTGAPTEWAAWIPKSVTENLAYLYGDVAEGRTPGFLGSRR